MEVLTKIISNECTQYLVGIFFACWILLESVKSFFSLNKIVSKYQELTHIIKNSTKCENSEELYFENQVIEGIVENFKNSTIKGTSDINTEVIIEKNLNKEEIFKREKYIKSTPSKCIALGLLGTFLGLTFAIAQARGVLGDALGSTQMFGEAMEGPFRSMSLAFVTTIFGVSRSAFLTEKNIKMENSKEEFYDYMEDYLDNEIYSEYSPNLANVIGESMKDLTGEIGKLFKEGIEELVSKVNNNTLNLTSMVEELSNYTQDLDRLTDSLDKSVNNFKDPVNKFRVGIDGYIQSTERTAVLIQDAGNSFGRNVDILMKGLRDIDYIINENKKEIKSIGDELENKVDFINTKQENLIQDTKNILIENRDIQDNLREELHNLGEVYFDLNNTLDEFNDDFRKNQENVSEKLIKKVSEELNDLSMEVKENIKVDVERLHNACDEINSNISDVGNMIKETNDLHNKIYKTID